MLRDRLGARSCTFSSASESAQQAKLFSAYNKQAQEDGRGWEKSEEIRVWISFYRMSRQNSRCQPLNTFGNFSTFPPRIILCPPRRAWLAMAGREAYAGDVVERLNEKSSLFHLQVYSAGVLRYSNEKFRPFFISLDTSDDDDDDDCKASVNRGSLSARLFSSFSTSRRRREREQSCEFVAFDSLIFSRRVKNVLSPVWAFQLLERRLSTNQTIKCDISCWKVVHFYSMLNIPLV